MTTKTTVIIKLYQIFYELRCPKNHGDRCKLVLNFENPCFSPKITKFTISIIRTVSYYAELVTIITL